MIFDESELKDWNKCPWCSDNSKEFLYNVKNNIEVVKCKKCGLVYSTKVLNELGLKKYWGAYESNVHQKNQQLSNDRIKMYEIEYEFISQFLCNKVHKILDVGCGGGEFLDFFKEHGHICEGVEYGEEAAEIAGKKYKIYKGEFPNINIKEQYDLIIFRGTIQYFQNPKAYFDKAVQLLKKSGLIFITSSPNSDSICFKLFKGKYNQKVCETDYCMYNETILSNYFNERGCVLVGKTHFYMNTPYECFEEDILKVSNAIKMKKDNQVIDFVSPAFFDNMLTLVYKKI